MDSHWDLRHDCSPIEFTYSKSNGLWHTQMTLGRRAIHRINTLYTDGIYHLDWTGLMCNEDFYPGFLKAQSR